MLLNDFYTIESWVNDKTAAGEVGAVLVLDPAHAIFAGHFPGQPVVPGACELQMVEELLSHILDTQYRLVSAGQIKFLTPIDPRRHPRIEAALRYSVAVTPAGADRGAAKAEGEPPQVTGEPLQVTVERERMQVTASFFAGETIFLKFTGIFRAG